VPSKGFFRCALASLLAIFIIFTKAYWLHRIATTAAGRGEGKQNREVPSCASSPQIHRFIAFLGFCCWCFSTHTSHSSLLFPCWVISWLVDSAAASVFTHSLTSTRVHAARPPRPHKQTHAIASTPPARLSPFPRVSTFLLLRLCACPVCAHCLKMCVCMFWCVSTAGRQAGRDMLALHAF